MRETARSTVQEITDLVSDALAYSVVKTLPDTHLHIGRPDPFSSPSRLPLQIYSAIAALADVTHSEL
ncbi:hypothetical protein BS47DRAFT_1483671 [Hydnum rufescens UP504]|uniref:Uncharacterized protein n=1 Tax=Hydnum rufescens UP504 TaxID=1448309 RepID=A0A9P6B3J0_9AGAM|nr:hypothetical protein BS47DRAFT_1483671 [Hydnum rufescens UP504]